MPELPEVETIVRDLRPQLTGRVVLNAFAALPGVLRHPDPSSFGERLRGRALARVGRQGKFIMIDLAGPGEPPPEQPGPEDELLVVHLGMTGRLGLADPEAELPPHTHLRLLLSSGAELRMQDYRRFGRVLLGRRAELLTAGALPPLGPEPFGGMLTYPMFSATLRRSRRAVKALLLDQAAIAGLGNIYCDEACFRAGVRPTAIAARLGPERRRRLYDAIHAALASAVDLRGTTFDDYRDAQGEKGRNQEVLLVYGRAGRPCVTCGGRLDRTVIAGRTTVFCRRCQR
ncbi:MAG TPA: bifunctional DNA-formamidopyrimidine glycosylase/DNA-(apurinic or apyrimidinic site) lyase [Candidatus Dormibacteraeota bacterium]|nr:bifunctional DNA-formamidopyrimidine glycosylase/DNA-(apurinic or apyrimidinic site) lyase [Candidatus Dormibacteraeota bacterium]